LESPGKKTSTTLLVIVIGLIVVLAAVAVTEVYFLSSNGSSETQTMSYSGFTAVDVGSAFKVTITQSATYSVVITANEKIFDRIQVTQNGNTLKIDVQPGTTFTGISNLAAQIAMPELTSVVLSGATRGTASGFRSTGPFAANLSGASSLEMTNFEAGNTTVDLSGASRFTATGSANDLVAVIAEASTLDSLGLPVNNANVTLSEASSAQINVNGRLDADLSGASSLQYSGQPTLGSITTSGASSITRR
jgi:hypothetical protein